jgi:8-oxo-dGTP diphosphatase
MKTPRSKFVAVGVGVIVRKEGRLLMLRRANVHGSGTWSTPGGHLEFGETPEACGVREVEEETGLKVVNPRFYAITNDHFVEHDKHYITIWIEADYVGGEPSLTAPEESDRVEWIAREAMPKEIFLSFGKVLSGQTSPPRSI